MSIPQYLMGQVGQIDFSPVENALTRLLKQQEMQKNYALQQERMGMDRERLGFDRDRFGFERQRFQDEQRRNEELGRILDPGNPVFREIPAPLMTVAQATRNPAPILQHYANQGKGTDDIKEFEYAVRGGFKGTFTDWMATKRKGAEEEFNKNVLYGTDERGNIVPMQAGTRGNLVASKLPPGVTLQRDPIKFDAGDRYILLDPTTRQPIGQIPKNIAGVEEQKAIGDDRGKIITTAPKLIASVESLEQQHRIVKDDIRRALDLTDRAAAAGVPSLVTSKVPGTAGYQLARLIETIKGNVGFDKLQQMRAESPTGGALGQVAVQELQYLQSVLGSLEQAQDPVTIQDNLLRLNAFLSESAGRRRAILDADLKRGGVSPDLLNRQQNVNPIDFRMANVKGSPAATDQREFVGMQPISGVGTPVSPEPAAPPQQPAPAPLPPQRRVYPTPTPEIVQELLRYNSPADRESFDRAFGPGAAEAYLKGRR